MHDRYRSAVIFQPSAYSYGAEEAAEVPVDPAADQASTAETVSAWLPAVKTALGIDDPRKMVATLENRLRDLKHGTPAEKTGAMLAAGSLTIPSAITKTERKLEEAQAAAFQTRTRDALYTALTITGVVAGGMLALFLAGKVYTTVQQGRIQQVELERLRRQG
jgi:hypothetical protein